MIMEAIERTCVHNDPVLIEYELTIGERQFFEARLVRAGQDRVLSIVRDVTDAKYALERNRHLAGRLIASQEAERTRIARDLHDGVCQDVAAVSVDLSHLRRHAADVQSAKVQQILLDVERRTAGVAEDLRLLSHGLHPSVLHHIGLVPALQAHCAEVERQHQLHVRFAAEGDVESLNNLVDLSLFRIAQEALGNTARHGHAARATVSLQRHDAELALTITDDGQGFDVIAARRNGGLGIVSMEERARLLRGKFMIRSTPGSGTTVDVRVPFEVVEHGVDGEPEPYRGLSGTSRTGPCIEELSDEYAATNRFAR
jgi:signal transduction histidine kinase